MQELRDDTKNGSKETGPSCEEDITSKIFPNPERRGGGGGGGGEIIKSIKPR